MVAQSQFRLSLAKFAAKAGDRADEVMRVCALEMLSRICLRTPVDSGRLRGNWQVSIGAPVTSEIDRKDKTENAGPTVAAGSSVIARYTSGPSIWITNNLPYAVSIEYGLRRRKGPAAMIRLTQREFKGIVGASVVSAKRAHP